MTPRLAILTRPPHSHDGSDAGIVSVIDHAPPQVMLATAHLSLFFAEMMLYREKPYSIGKKTEAVAVKMESSAVRAPAFSNGSAKWWSGQAVQQAPEIMDMRSSRCMLSS